jgi:vomeronasal 2 receptor
MNLFQLNSFLKDIEVGGQMRLDWRQEVNVKYDILNIWNLPKGLGRKVKIGSFSPNAPQGQQLSLTEQIIQWPEEFSEVCYVLSQCFECMLVIKFCFPEQ